MSPGMMASAGGQKHAPENTRSMLLTDIEADRESVNSQASVFLCGCFVRGNL